MIYFPRPGSATLLHAQDTEKVIPPERTPPRGCPRICDVLVLYFELSPTFTIAVDLAEIAEILLAERAPVVDVSLQPTLVELAEFFPIYREAFSHWSQAISPADFCVNIFGAIKY